MATRGFASRGRAPESLSAGIEMSIVALRAVIRLAAALLAVQLASSATAQGPDIDSRKLEDWSRSRLAASFGAIAEEMLNDPRVVVPQLELAFGLRELACELDPDSPHAWRRLFELATAVEAELEGAPEAKRRAIEALVRLDPDDPVNRLRLLLDRIDERPTAQERRAGLELLLDPENIGRLGNAAAARVAYDLGLLEMRIGDMDEAARRIAQAVQLDPTFPQAADMAAGLFRAVVPTPIDEAELLAIAFAASPGDPVIARSLGELVLQSGAYASADDVLELAGLLLPSDGFGQEPLAADRILAAWGDGRLEDARRLVDQSRRRWTAMLRTWLVENQGLSDAAVAEMEIPPSPDVALVAAVLEARTGDESSKEAARTALFQSYRFELRRMRLTFEAATSEDLEIPEDERRRLAQQYRTRRAGVLADLAWARAWFGEDTSPDEASGSLDDADLSGSETPAGSMSLQDLLRGAVAGGAIDDTQKLVIEGWAAIGRSEYEQARTLLGPASESSPYAEAGLALLDEIEGRRKEAARGFLAVFNARPGSLVGLWCRSRLESILATSVPAPEQADLMTQMLEATLPRAVGQLVRDARHGALSVSIDSSEQRFSPFEAVTITASVTNVSSLELAIGPDAPIQPTFALVADIADIIGSPRSEDRFRLAHPILVSLDRRFSLAPQETIELELDLTSTYLQRDLVLASILGGSFRIRGVANYRIVASGNVDPGTFGREGSTPVFRVDGIDPSSAAKVDVMIERMQSADSISDAKDVAALLELTTALPDRVPELDDEVPWLAATDACLSLPPVARAWALSVLEPGIDRVNRITDRLVEDGDPASLALALVRFSPSPTSAAILAGLESPDPRIRRMAASARELALLVERQQEKNLIDFGD